MKSENLVIEPNALPTAHSFLEAFVSRFITPATEQIQLSEEEKLIVALRDAHKDWLIAKSNFTHACDLDLIDQAIYNIAAAEKRYQYLLKQARQENIRAEIEDWELERSQIKYNVINM